MNIKRLIARNVFKYDELDITFDNRTYLILANVSGDFDKSNGVGKSAIIELVMFCLFGETLRGLDDISKYHSGKFYVELEFDDNKIVRTEKGIILYVKGEKFERKKTQGQELINNIIKLDADMLNYTNIFSPESNFFKLEDAKKKDILLKLINIDFIDEVYEIVKEKVKVLESARMDKVIEIYEDEVKIIDDITLKENKARKELEAVQGYEVGIKDYWDFKKDIDKKIQDYTELYRDNARLRTKLKSVKDQLAEVVIEDVGKLRETLTEARTQKGLWEIKVTDNTKLINTISSVKECPVFKGVECDKLSNPDYRAKLVESYQAVIKEATTNINTLKDTVNDVNDKITESDRAQQRYNEKKATFEAERVTYYNDKEKLVKQREVNKQLMASKKHLLKYKDVKVSLQDIRTKQLEHTEALMHLKTLTDKKEKLTQYKIKNDQVHKDIATYEVLKKFFGKDGFKQFVVSKIISFLEFEINNMVTNIFQDMSVKFSTSFEVEKRNMLKIKVIRGKNEVNFNEFSAGERRIFEVIFQIALYRLFKTFSNQSINFLAFDEVFDALDKHNSEIVVDIIDLLKDENKTIFVISHKQYIQELFENKLVIMSDGKNSWMEKDIKNGQKS